MTNDHTRTALALLMVAGFFAVVMIVLLGLVDVKDPTIAKIVGTLVGYVMAVLNPVIYRYFGTHQGPAP